MQINYNKTSMQAKTIHKINANFYMLYNKLITDRKEKNNLLYYIFRSLISAFIIDFFDNEIQFLENNKVNNIIVFIIQKIQDGFFIYI
jgi:hypothetical protein